VAHLGCNAYLSVLPRLHTTSKLADLAKALKAGKKSQGESPGAISHRIPTPWAKARRRSDELGIGRNETT
jgi:hypothetical protein